MNQDADIERWDYRVLRDEHNLFRIVEVYYSEDGSISGWCTATPLGETEEELRVDLIAQLASLALPILTYGEDEDHDPILVPLDLDGEEQRS